MKPLPPAVTMTSHRSVVGHASSLSRPAGILPTATRFSAAILLGLTSLLPHTALGQGGITPPINPDPVSYPITGLTIKQNVPDGDAYDPLVPLPGKEAYEIPADHTGRISISLNITHQVEGTLTTSIRDSAGFEVTSATGNEPTLVFEPLKHRYPFLITIQAPAGELLHTKLIAPPGGGVAIDPGFTGQPTSTPANLETDGEYRIDQGDDSGDYAIEGKDTSSGTCGSCQSSSCDLTHSDETASADPFGESGRFLAGFSAGISMQGDSSSGVDASFDPATGVTRAAFSAHGTGGAAITRTGSDLATITTGSAHTKIENASGGVQVSISKTSTSNPFRKITFTNNGTNSIKRTSKLLDPAASSETVLKSVETLWTYSTTGTHPTWTIITGNGARKSELILEQNTDTQRQQRRKLYERAYGASGTAAVLVAEVLETYQKTLLGWRKTKSEVIGTTGAPLTTTWGYYGPGDGPTQAGLLKYVTHPDGATEDHTYTKATENLHTITRAFAAGGTLVETRTKSLTGGGSPVLTTTVETKVGTQAVSRHQDTWSGNTLDRSYNDGTADRTTAHIITPFGSDFGGLPTTVDMPDGTRITQAHTRSGSGAGALRNLTVSRGSPSGGGIGDGTSTSTTRDQNGILRTKFVTALGIGDGTVLNHLVVDENDRDDLGRPETFQYFPDGDGIPAYTLQREYACCGLLSETDRYGITTTYQYDDLGRRTHTHHQGVTHATRYDALTITTHRYPQNPSTTPSATNQISATTRNLNATEVVSSSPDPSAIDGSGNGIPGALATTTTTVTYSSTGTTTLTTVPGLGTQTTYTHPGGRTWKTIGTLAPQRIHAYAVNATGLVVATAYLIQDGENPVIAEATATQYDRAGRTHASGILPDLASATLLAANDDPGATLTQATRYFYGTAGTATGKLIKVTDADGVTTLYAFNAKGERTISALKLDTEPTITYGIDQVSLTQTTPASRDDIPVVRTVTKVWQDNDDDDDWETGGTIVSQTDRTPDGLQSWSWQLGRGTTHTQTTLNNPADGDWTTTTTYPDGTKTRQTHTNGLLTLAEQLNNALTPAVISSTTYQYDGLNRPWKSIDSRTATAGTTTTTYLSTTADYTKSIADPASRTTSFTYDPHGRTTATSLPDTTVSHTTYTPRGEIQSRHGSQTYPEFRTYDHAGRLKTLRTKPDFDADIPINTGGSLTTWNYSTTDGRLSSKRDDMNFGADYAYTPAGRLFTREWARFTPQNQRLTTTYGYAAGGRLETIDYNDDTPDVALQTDALGRRKSITNTLSTTVYGYNDDDTLALETETITTAGITRTLHRHRDALGRNEGWELKDSGTPIHHNEYRYHSAHGRLHEIESPVGTYAYTYQTGSQHLISGITAPLHTVTNTWEPSRNVLDTKQNNIVNNLISSYDYTVNEIGQRETVLTDGIAFGNTDRGWQWGYDALGQVTSATHAAETDLDHAYQYDAIGNRLFAETANTEISDPPVAATTTYSPNSLNQYDQINTLTPTHDDDGNATAWPLPVDPSQTHTLVWDAENRLIEVLDGTTTLVTYGYDAQSRRVTTTIGSNTTVTFYDAWNPIVEYASGTLHKTYTWGLDLSGTLQGAGGVGGLLAVQNHEGGTGITGIFHALYDGNGNVTQYIRDNNPMQSGITVTSIEYDPFGNVIALTEDITGIAAHLPHGFSTKPKDPTTGLLYYGYRWYDPATGRWPSRDPIGEQGGMNLYGFVRNASADFVDYLGRMIADGSDGQIGQPLKRCEIEIRVHHLISGDNGNFKDFKSRDFENAPSCSRIGYVGCGANWLNSQIPKEHSAQIAPIEEDTKLTEKDYKSAIDQGIPKDALNQGLVGYTSDLINDIDSAVSSAQKNVGDMCRPKGCCQTVKMRINCLEDDIEDRVNKMLTDFIVSGGRFEDFNRSDAVSKAMTESKCGKISIYDCSSKRWSNFFDLK